MMSALAFVLFLMVLFTCLRPVLDWRLGLAERPTGHEIGKHVLNVTDAGCTWSSRLAWWGAVAALGAWRMPVLAGGRSVLDLVLLYGSVGGGLGALVAILIVWLRPLTARTGDQVDWLTARIKGPVVPSSPATLGNPAGPAEVPASAARFAAAPAQQRHRAKRNGRGARK